MAVSNTKPIFALRSILIFGCLIIGIVIIFVWDFNSTLHQENGLRNLDPSATNINRSDLDQIQAEGINSATLADDSEQSQSQLLGKDRQKREEVASSLMDASIHGTVFDEAGRPIEKAKISINWKFLIINCTLEVLSTHEH